MKFTKNEKFLGLVIVFTYILIYGSVLNQIVIQNNGNKMPVLINEYSFNDQTHFSFTKTNSVKFWYLSDIFYIGNYIYSFGDILLYQGLFTIPLCIFLYFKNKFRESKW